MMATRTRPQQSNAQDVMGVYKERDGDEVTLGFPKLHVGEGRKYGYQVRTSGQSGLA